MLRIVSALTPSLALELERDLLRRADLHLIDVTTISQLVAAARDGALLALVEPLLPDGNARDALDELASLDDKVPLVLVATAEARRELGDHGFAAVIELPFTGGAFDDVLGRLIDAPRRRGRRREISARVYDDQGEAMGRAIDVAAGGIALRTHRAFTVGEQVDLSLELPGSPRLAAKGKVVRAIGEHAALAFETQSDALREQLRGLTNESANAEGLSFQPLSGEPLPGSDVRMAAIGGTFVEGVALSALVTYLSEGRAHELVVRDLHPFDEAALTRFITVRTELDTLGPLTLRACPAWLGALMSRMPAVLGPRGRVASLAVGLRCTNCGDHYDEEIDLPSSAAEATALLTAGQPCAVCGSMLEPAVPPAATLAFLDAT